MASRPSPRTRVHGGGVILILTHVRRGPSVPVMSRRISATFAVLLALVAGARATPAPGQVEWTPAPGVLVLRNGSVLHGQITHLGDRYLVTLASSSELRLSEADVEMVCRTLPEAYQRRLANLTRPDVPSFLDLAEWCLRHEMLAQAADALTRATQLEPDNPRLERLQARLEQAARGPQAPAKPAAVSAPPASLDQLEQLIRDLPYGSLERFSSAIQPMLLNRCGANNCHGPASSSAFHLVRPPLGQTATRRFTLRNLHATLQTIRVDSPDESPLLTVIREPHGPVRAAVFNPHEQVQYEQLAAWVRQISQPRREPQPASIAGGDGRLHQAAPVTPGGASPAGESPESAEPVTAGAESPRTTALPAAPGSTSPLADAPAVDPFDPEVFNRRYFAKPQPIKR